MSILQVGTLRHGGQRGDSPELPQFCCPGREEGELTAELLYIMTLLSPEHPFLIIVEDQSHFR